MRRRTRSKGAAAVPTSSLGERISRGWMGLAGVLDALAEAVTIRDRNGAIVYANRAAVRSMGFSSSEEMLMHSSQGIMDAYDVQDEHGNPLSLNDVPSMRIMQGDDAEA